MIKLENITHILSEEFRLSIEKLYLSTDKATIYIVGPSGSGKTTLLRCMCGLDIPNNGTVELDGYSLKQLKIDNKLHTLRMMYMSQELGLWNHMSCYEHISFMLQNKDAKKVLYWLAKVQLEKKQECKPEQLSLGEQQRLALARALCIEPLYLFLDEPFASLDLVLAAELQELLKSEQTQSEFTLVQVSHQNLNFKENEVIIVVDKGCIIQAGISSEVIANPVGDWSKKWVSFITKNI